MGNGFVRNGYRNSGRGAVAGVGEKLARFCCQGNILFLSEKCARSIGRAQPPVIRLPLPILSYYPDVKYPDIDHYF